MNIAVILIQKTVSPSV